MHAVSGLQDARVRGVRQLPRAAETAVRGAQLRAARAGHGLHLLHLQPGRLVRLHTHVPHRQVQTLANCYHFIIQWRFLLC